MTDALREEGLARDLVNRVQNLRKDMELEVQNKIHIKIVEGEELVQRAVASHKNYICRETQALSLEFVKSTDQGKPVEIDGLSLELEISVKED